MLQVQFPDRRMPNHRIFQWLHRQLHETRSFHVTKHDAGRQRAVRSPSLKESILNVVTHRPESSIRAVAHHVSVGPHTVCRALSTRSFHVTNHDAGRRRAVRSPSLKESILSIVTDKPV
ncbi:uncharacterized protein TNCV_1875421 [Trichonephila clavipes]|nr:uncharacterized protein TNCV_1875421 [Trichonephila clavipes]